MDAKTRRIEILNSLNSACEPISASALAQRYGVSRQVVVQDIALLRAQGFEISSLTKGYIITKNGNFKRVFKVIHSDEDVEKELNMIVDAGGIVDDVFVYHKIYGRVSAKMNIRSRLNVKNFLQGISSGKSSLLKNITSGYHYHTVYADSENTLELIKERLKSEGFLAPLTEFEPSDF